MVVALWSTGLLLSFLCVCACGEQECVLGRVGRPVLLSCVHPDVTPFGNFSIEWRRDDEVVLRWAWEDGGHQADTRGLSNVTMSGDAARTGNFSLGLPPLHPDEDNVSYSLFVNPPGNLSVHLCTVCLRIAASFSSPMLRREAAAGETVFLCHSSGGFPEPDVRWLINNVQVPSKDSVRTLVVPLPGSHLYNITSYLTANVSADSNVSCTVHNLHINESLTSTSCGVRGSLVARRASEAMWIFSTALCVVVGVMVVIGVVYQIHLDRRSKRKKKQYQYHYTGSEYKRQSVPLEESEAMKSQPKETDV